MTVRELGARLDARELVEWRAYDRLEPVGPGRQDVLFAMLASVLANCHRDSGRAAYTHRDFLPEWAPRRRPRVDEGAMRETAIALVKSMGGEVKGGDTRPGGQEHHLAGGHRGRGPGA